MCCIGCQAVAQTIIDNGLEDYYRYRTENSTKATDLIPEALKQNRLLDEAVLQDEFARDIDQDRETLLSIDGMTCAACAWLIEKQIETVPGVVAISVNATTQRATIRWQKNALQLSEILNKIARIGYHALPFKANEAEQRNKQQSKTFIKRLGISGILMMQVMMIAIGLYFGAFSDISEHHQTYLRYVSLILTIPIVTYGAFPFYTGAISALKAKRLSMDVPVSVAIVLASCASAWATVSNSGEVYFESVSMFTFLLLIGKFLEFRARSKAAEVSANLLKLMPMTATKLEGNNETIVAAKSLAPFDKVLIKPGETVSSDGIVIMGSTSINESMLSGEHDPVGKSIGDKVFAGTVNGDGNITIEVTNAANNSVLSQLIRLSEQCQAYKPKLAQLSDKIAQYFVALILVTAIGSSIYWYQHDPSHAFWITIAVLVATCPCALSLATPTALTSAVIRLNREGIMVKSAHVLETLPSISDFAFDKTGTLTTGNFKVSKVSVFTNQYDQSHVLSLAAKLEAYSEHPLAKAFVEYKSSDFEVSNITVVAGAGITGKFNNQEIAIGKPKWLCNQVQSDLVNGAQCVLTINNELVAAFYLADHIRPDALTLITQLKEASLNTAIISGDHRQGCDKVQQQLTLDEVHSECTADVKLSIINSKTKQGRTIAMVGDGVNDTPVFGAAHVSIAMGSGTDIAKSGADVILLTNKLSSVWLLRRIAIKTKRIIIENYCWAFGYNAIVLPLAVSGNITPYWAVIGMSASSILVVTNSLRLLKK